MCSSDLVNVDLCPPSNNHELFLSKCMEDASSETQFFEPCPTWKFHITKNDDWRKDMCS